MSTEISRFRATSSVCPAQVRKTANKARPTLGTELSGVMKVHALLERLISGDAQLPRINEQLDATFTPEELVNKLELALQYSDRPPGKIAFVRRDIKKFERTVV